MALLVNIEDVKKYVAVNKNIDWNTIKPYAKQADRKFIKPLIGDEVYALYPDINPSDTLHSNAEQKTISEVYNLLREASANLMWFLYLPLAQVQVSDAGITVNAVESSKAAEWWQIRDLRRSFVDAGFMALDEALKLMEGNEALFSGWSTSEGYTLFNQLFVKRTDTFNRWFGIGNSRRTFLALRPYMLEAHHQFYTAKFNLDTIEAINALTNVDPETYQVLDLLQASMVNYTIYKAVNSGMFEITENGIYEKVEDFPGYKTKQLDQPQIHRIKEDRLAAAEEYYKKAIKVIEANPTVFTAYQIKETAAFVKPKNTGSIVSF